MSALRKARPLRSAGRFSTCGIGVSSINTGITGIPRCKAVAISSRTKSVGSSIRRLPLPRPPNQVGPMTAITTRARSNVCLICSRKSTPYGMESKSIKTFPLLPNPGVGVVGTNAAGIGPGVDRQEANVDGGGDVHRAAIDADDKTRHPDEPNELQKRSLIGELDTIFGDVDVAICFSNNDHPRRRKRETNVLDHAVGQ